jgi:hypothetical protein
MARDYDGYGFHVASCSFNTPEERSEGFALIKDMLRVENKYRLSEEYQNEYSKSDDSDWKSEVTETLQRRVVTEFFSDPRSKRLFTDVPQGIDFLRGAVGTFPEHLDSLMSCANYVRFTQNCRRGPLRVGDKVDGKGIPLVDPHTMAESSLAHYIDRGTQSSRPLVLIASSYT